MKTWRGVELTRGHRDQATLLVVHADAAARSALVRTLREAGHRAEGVERVTQAIERLESIRADVVVVGASLGELRAVTQCVGVLTTSEAPSVLAVLECEGVGACEAAVAAGVDEVVATSSGPDALLLRVDTLLRLRESERELARQAARLAALTDDALQADRAREQLWRTQRMESIGRLAGGVAHDFNNALTAIISFTRFVVDGLAEGDPRREDLIEVLKAADGAAKLTGQLLAFSRSRPVQPAVLDLDAALHNVERVLRRMVGDAIELVVEPAAEAACALIDPGHFDQIVFNLVLNARDAMPGGGKVVLRVRTVARAAGDEVELVVSDSGSGMTPEVQARAFEPFFSTKGERGTGLGLSTCYGIAQQAGGSIRVASEVGQGTTFTLSLPRVTGTAPERKRVSLGGAAIGLRGTVLVVEDQPMLLRSMRRAFELAGLDVESAKSAEDALSLIEEKQLRPDLLATDIVLPGMSGIGLAERLRAGRAELPVLYVSGHAGEERVRGVKTDQHTSFIAKPFSGTQLVFRAATLLGETHATP